VGERREFWVEEEKTLYSVEWKLDDRGYVSDVRVERTHYPIHPYGNYVKDVAKIYWSSERPGAICIEVYRVKQSWGGTGRDDLLWLCFDEYSPETPWFLERSELEGITTAECVKEYLRGVVQYVFSVLEESLGW